MKQALFDKGDAVPPSPGEVAAAQPMGGDPRLRVPRRNQVEMHWASLDELLEPDHPARMVGAFVCGLDLGRWLTTIKAVEGVAGRDATDPRLLVALWIYATILADESVEDANRRRQAARRRASEERQRRLEEAIGHCDQLRQQREETSKITGKKPVEARASTTDPEARTMKFPDGGYRPGYNVQFSTGLLKTSMTGDGFCRLFLFRVSVSFAPQGHGSPSPGQRPGE